MGWPVKLDTINLYRGDTRTLRFQFWEDAGQTVPVDLTQLGTVYTSQVRATPDSSTVVGTLTVDPIDAATGVLLVDIDVSFWANITTSTRLKWDLQVSDSADAPTLIVTLVSGTFVVAMDVTRV